MKLIEFRLETKDNTTVYESAEQHVKESSCIAIVPRAEIIEKDFVAAIFIKYEKNGEKLNIIIMSYDAESLMTWLKEHHPDVYELVPSFRMDKFVFLANKMVSGSYLTYRALPTECPLEYEFGIDPEADDFVPEKETVEESIKEIVEKGFYTSLRIYPDTPVGNCVFYGTDFQSLLDHVITD